MIDWQRVSDLREEVGADEFHEVAALFLEEVEEALEPLAAGSTEGLGPRLHFLKGSALNIGFARMAAICSEGERLAASGNAAGIDLGELLEVYAVSRNMFLDGPPGRTVS